MSIFLGEMHTSLKEKNFEGAPVTIVQIVFVFIRLMQRGRGFKPMLTILLGDIDTPRPFSPIVLPLEKAESLLPSGLGLDINHDSEVNGESSKPSTQTLIIKEEKIEPVIPPQDMSLPVEARSDVEGEAGTQASASSTSGDVTPAVPASGIIGSLSTLLTAPLVAEEIRSKGKQKQNALSAASLPTIAKRSPTTLGRDQDAPAAQKQPHDLSPAPPLSSNASSIKRQGGITGISTSSPARMHRTPLTSHLAVTTILTSMGPPPQPAINIHSGPSGSHATLTSKKMRITPSPFTSNTSAPPQLQPITTPALGKKTLAGNLDLTPQLVTSANRDDFFSDTASTTSSARALSPTPSGMNSPRTAPGGTIKSKSKATLKKELQKLQKLQKLPSPVAATVPTNTGNIVGGVESEGMSTRSGKQQERKSEEEHAPVVARQTKKRDKKKKKQAVEQVCSTNGVTGGTLPTATATPGSSRPESPIPASVGGNEGGSTPQTELVGQRQPTQQQQQQQQQTSVEDNIAEKPPTTILTAAQILHDLAISDEIKFSDLEMLKPVVGLSHKFDISPAEIRAFDRSINQVPMLSPLPGNANDGEQLRAPLVTGSNIILRGLTREQEERFLTWEEKVLEGRKSPYRWTPLAKSTSSVTAGLGDVNSGRCMGDELSDVSSWWKDAKRTISASLAPVDRERLTSAIAAAVGLADQALSGASGNMGDRFHQHSHQHHFHHHHHSHGHVHHHPHQFTGEDDQEDILVPENDESVAPRITVDDALSCLSSLFPPEFAPPFTGEYKVSVDFTPACCPRASGSGVVGDTVEGVGAGEYEFTVGQREDGSAVGGTITLSATASPGLNTSGVPEITISSAGKHSHGHGNHHHHHHTATATVPVPANLANTMNGVISGMIGGLSLPGFGVGGVGVGAVMGMGMLGAALPSAALARLGSLGGAGTGISSGTGAAAGAGIGAQGLVSLSVEEAEKQLVQKRKETEVLERKLNQLLKRNRRLAGL